MWPHKSTSIVVIAVLGLLAPACDEEPEDPAGAAWVPPASGGSGDDDNGSSGDEDDGASGWSAGGSASDTWDTWGESEGSTGAQDSVGETSAPGSSGDDSSTSGEPGGGESPYAGGWDVGACDSASGPGDTIVGSDQHGENVYLRDFCHKAVLFVLGNFT